ncbi:hypothetical protein CF319_g7992 [Tilletia indica]|nr:hypothetical protein CF319_g7992 [Tilletia indica]
MDEFTSAYGDLERAVRRCAAAASAIGVRPDWLSVLHQMCPDLVPSPLFPPLPPAPPASSTSPTTSPLPSIPLPRSLAGPSSSPSFIAPARSVPSACSTSSSESSSAPPPVAPAARSSTVLSSPPSAASSTAASQQFDCVSLPVTDLGRQWPTPDPLPLRPARFGTQMTPRNPQPLPLPIGPAELVHTTLAEDRPHSGNLASSPSPTTCWSCRSSYSSGGWRGRVEELAYPGSLCAACYSRELRAKRKTALPLQHHRRLSTLHHPPHKIKTDDLQLRPHHQQQSGPSNCRPHHDHKDVVSGLWCPCNSLLPACTEHHQSPTTRSWSPSLQLVSQCPSTFSFKSTAPCSHPLPPADGFYSRLAAGPISDGIRGIMRQALAGMLWNRSLLFSSHTTLLPTATVSGSKVIAHTSSLLRIPNFLPRSGLPGVTDITHH